MPTGTLHAVILAGGTGTRFWPLSRSRAPKQLFSIVGDRSMLALTLERTKALVPEDHVWVVTTRSQEAIRQEGPSGDETNGSRLSCLSKETFAVVGSGKYLRPSRRTALPVPPGRAPNLPPP
jgi:mannose-1-phosphate guanylyltransferase